MIKFNKINVFSRLMKKDRSFGGLVKAISVTLSFFECQGADIATSCPQHTPFGITVIQKW
jgi:hypothetical protein